MRPIQNWITAATLAIVAAAALQAQTTPLEIATQLEAQAKVAEQGGRLSEAFELYVKTAQALPVRTSRRQSTRTTNLTMTPQYRAMFDIDVHVRERLVALAKNVQPLPQPPADALRFGIRGKTLFNDAKDASDRAALDRAMSELENAVHAAPWVPEHAFNLALVQEKLGYFKAAIANLKVYAASGELDANDAWTKSFELEVRREDPQAALREDCDFFNIAFACLKRGRQLTARSFESDPTGWVEGTQTLWWGCVLGSAQACYEHGREALANSLDSENASFRVAKILDKPRQPPGLAAVEVSLGELQRACVEKVPAGCRELGAFFSKDWSQLGVRKNRKTAADWYQRACDLDPVANKADCEQAKRLR